LCLYNWIDKKPQSNPCIGKKEVKSTQKQPSCENVVQLKAWVKKVVKSNVAAKKWLQ